MNFKKIKKMKKKLTRKDKKILGVCGGLGDYFDLDPIVFRAVFIASFLAFGQGLLIYLVLAFLMPKFEPIDSL